MFGLRSFMQWGMRGIGALTSKITGEGSRKAADAVTDLTAAGAKDLPGNAAQIIDRAHKGGFFSTLGKIGGGVGVFLGIEAGVNGQKSLLGKWFQNVSEGAKNIDAQTDTSALFVRFGEILKNIMKFFNNFGDIASGRKSVREIFSEENSATNRNGQPNSGTPLGNPVSYTLGMDVPVEGKMGTAVEYAALAGGAYGAKKTYDFFKATRADKVVADNVETGFEAVGKGLGGRLSGAFFKSAVKSNLLVAAIGGAGLFIGSKAFGATNEQALDNSTSLLPFKDAFVQAEAGNTDAAIRSFAIDGATVGAGLGATAGAMFFGVGAVPGAVIGGVVGAGVNLAASYFWSEPAPQPTPVAVLENMDAQFQTAALDTTPVAPDYTNAWGGAKAATDTRRNNKGMHLNAVPA